jgi:class 3 adenylate cyclase
MSAATSLGEWLAESVPVGIVFTDIVGSTLLLHRQQTKNYAVILRAHQARASQLTTAFEGRLVTNVGDEMLTVFRSARAAFEFARHFFEDAGHPQLSIRAGVHFGTVHADGPDLVGRHVHFGARVMAHGRDHELWVSDAAKSALEAESAGFSSGIHWMCSEDCELKGVPEVQRLWRAG